MDASRILKQQQTHNEQAVAQTKVDTIISPLVAQDSSPAITLDQFIQVVKRFIALHRRGGVELAYEHCAHLSDPSGGTVVPDYLAYIAQQSGDEAPNVIHFHIPPAPPRPSDSYIPRAFLTQMGHPPLSREDRYDMDFRLQRLLEQNVPDLLILTGWEHVLYPKRHTVNERLASYIHYLLHAKWPHMSVLAICDLQLMEQITKSNVRLALMFYELDVPTN